MVLYESENFMKFIIQLIGYIVAGLLIGALIALLDMDITITQSTIIVAGTIFVTGVIDQITGAITKNITKDKYR